MVRYVVAGVLAVLVVVGVLLLPSEVAYTIEVTGKVWPAQSWTLVRDGAGSIGGMLHDHAEGTVQSYALNRFERGDFVQLTLQPGLKPDVDVAEGDTIATIFSSTTERELTQLTGELAATLAMLDVQTTGEKAAVVNEAQMQLAQAQEEATQHENILERQRALRAQALISEQELEIAESQHRVFLANIAAAQARLDALQTGEKPEQLSLTRTEVEALRNDIATLNNRLSLYTITAPIAGTVVRSFGSDTLLTVHHMDTFVVVMPVRWEEHLHLTVGADVTVQVAGLAEPIAAQVHQLGDTIHQLNGQSVVLVTALIEDGPRLLPGTVTRCQIAGGTLTLAQYVRRWFQAPLS